MEWKEKLNKRRDELNEVSPSFCLAKWLQVTLHLQNGYNHSCHHPKAHKIDEVALETDPTALHNTAFKKKQRKMMIEGERPPECEYCWKVEDSSSNEEFSDRIIKSSDEWAYPYLKEISTNRWYKNVNPKYIEVNFGYECNFTCAYCSAEVSSSIYAELVKEGAYPVNKTMTIEIMQKTNRTPIPNDKKNPYIDAFWAWFPDVVDDLQVFRITGGEPLINNNTFKLLDYFNENAKPHIDLSINSNFCVPDNRFEMFIRKCKNLIENKKVKGILVYTSIDTVGEQAEYIRYGLDEEKLFSNVDRFLKEVPLGRICFMSTFNLLSLGGFEELVKKVHRLKEKNLDKTSNVQRVIIDTSILHYPSYLCADLAPVEVKRLIWSSYDYVQRNIRSEQNPYGFDEYEINKIKRLGDWLESTIIKYDENPYYQNNEGWHNVKKLESRILKIQEKINKTRNKAMVSLLLEAGKMESLKILKWVKENKKYFVYFAMKRDCYKFLNEYDRRKGLDFCKVFPELVEMYKGFEKLELEMDLKTAGQLE
jgi:organic radical activating enzyme